VIPSMRGKLVSRPIGEVVNEAERLVRQGVRELLIVSQDTAVWCRSALPDRLRERQAGANRCSQSRVRAGRLGAWVRLHYVYPYPHIDDLVR